MDRQSAHLEPRILLDFSESMNETSSTVIDMEVYNLGLSQKEENFQGFTRVSWIRNSPTQKGEIESEIKIYGFYREKKRAETNPCTLPFEMLERK